MPPKKIKARKYYFRKPLEVFNKEQAREYLHINVFSTEEFDLHCKRAAVNLKLDESIVRDVVQSFWFHVFMAIQKARKLRTKINIYGFFSLEVEKGDRF